MKKRYLTYIKRHWYFFVLGPLFVILSALAEVLLPTITADIINVGIANRDIPYILEKGILMTVISVLTMVCSVAGACFAVGGGAHFAADLRRDIFGRVQEYSFANLDDLTTGSLITRITNDVSQIQTSVQQLMRMSLRAPVMMIGAIVMSFLLSPRLATVLCIIMPLLALAIFLLVRVSMPRYTGMQEQLDALNTRIGESIENERVIKSFVRESFEEERFLQVNDRLRARSMRALGLMLWLQPVSAIAINLGTLAVVWIAGGQIMVGEMELGTLTAFITYLSQVLSSLNVFANLFLNLSRAAASQRRIREIFDEALDMTELGADPQKKVTEGAIEMRNVSFRYFKDRPEAVLTDISFRVLPGETVGIIGSTGSGKSTLVSLIPRLYDCDEGQVLVDGVNVRNYTFENLRRGISVVLQKNTLFAGTVRENLYWGREDATDQELQRACDIAQAGEFIANLKDGYDTELGQGGITLSGGQKQRLCIATALLKKPRILILDDSTSALDTATDAAFRRALKANLSGTTCLVIAQRITSVIDADRILVLDNGHLVGNGRHEELMRSCRVYREIYQTQREGEEAI